MPTFGRDEFKVASSYPPLETVGSYKFDRPMTRIDTFVFDNDVFMQVAENDPPTFDNPNTELRIYKGFKSTPLERPATAVRFKAAAGIARVTLHAFSY